MVTITELQDKVEALEIVVADLRARVSNSEGVYVLNDDERRAVEEGLKDRIATDEEVVAVLSKYGLQGAL